MSNPPLQPCRFKCPRFVNVHRLLLMFELWYRALLVNGFYFIWVLFYFDGRSINRATLRTGLRLVAGAARMLTATPTPTSSVLNLV